jgi:O-antigen polysaccharide polymerase Wzy
LNRTTNFATSTPLLIFLLVVFCAAFQPTLDWVGLGFLLVMMGLVLMLHVVMQRAVTLTLVYYVFSLIFLNLLPWLHYTNSILIWRLTAIPESIYFLLNAMLLLSHCIVFLFYLKGVLPSSRNAGYTATKKKSSPLISFLLLGMSASGFLLLLFLNEFSLNSLLVRGLDYEFRNRAIDSSSLNLLLSQVSRVLPFFCFLYATMCIDGSRLLKIVLFTILLFSVFPTGVARYMVGMIYVPLALIYFTKFRQGGLFTTLLIAALLFIFPFLDQFREFAGFDTLKILPSIDFFYAAHFDAYENFASAIEMQFVTYGWQLIGVILFYVPRIFWPEKPIGSGQEMAEQLRYVFDNISMPFLGEGYVNFGIIGILLFAVILGFVFFKLDRFFAASVANFTGNSYITAFYFYLIGALFFVLRGDLLSSFAFTVAGVVVAFTVFKVMATVSQVKIGGYGISPPRRF